MTIKMGEDNEKKLNRSGASINEPVNNSSVGWMTNEYVY